MKSLVALQLMICNNELLREALLKAPPVYKLDGGKMSTKLKVATENAHEITIPYSITGIQYFFALQEAEHMVQQSLNGIQPLLSQRPFQ